MITKLLKRKKEIHLERSYPADLDAVWRAWTEADRLRQWWGPKNTTVTECEIDLQVGGSLHIVTEAGEGMGKYQGTRWPMAGTISVVDAQRRLTYDARSWTEGEEATTTIHHVNDITLAHADGTTHVTLHVAINQIGSKAKMAAFGMKWGYKQQLDNLAEVLSTAT